MAITKLTKPSLKDVESETLLFEEESNFDFGAPEIIEITLSNGLQLCFREPRVEDMIKLQDFEKKSKSEVENTLYTLTLLHHPKPGQPKLTMKDARLLTARQLKTIGKELGAMMSIASEEDNDEDDDSKS